MAHQKETQSQALVLVHRTPTYLCEFEDILIYIEVSGCSGLYSETLSKNKRERK